MCSSQANEILGHSKFKFLLLLASVLLLLSCLLTKQVYAQQHEYYLYVKPKECVSLHQGQTCYVDLELNWTAPTSDDYCVYIKGKTKALQCWTGAKNGDVVKEWETSEELVFELRLKDTDVTLVTTNLKLSWVYKTPPRARLAWRLF